MNQNSNEQIIRDHLKTLSIEDIADSVYLYGVDFDKAPIESIMEAIYSLNSEVKSLGSLVERNFEQEEGKHVRLPKDRVTKNVVIESYYQKESALRKILSNSYVYFVFDNYRKAREELEKQLVYQEEAKL